MSAPDNAAGAAEPVLYRCTVPGTNASDGRFLHSGEDYTITGDPHPDDAALIASGALALVPVDSSPRKSPRKAAPGGEEA